jgi:hypothetical protein
MPPQQPINESKTPKIIRKMSIILEKVSERAMK